MFHRLDGFAIRIRVFVGGSLPHKLLASLWVLALTEPREFVCGNRPGQSEVFSQATLPFAGDFAALRPVVLLLRREFFPVVALRLR